MAPRKPKTSSPTSKKTTKSGGGSMRSKPTPSSKGAAAAKSAPSGAGKPVADKDVGSRVKAAGEVVDAEVVKEVPPTKPSPSVKLAKPPTMPPIKPELKKPKEPAKKVPVREADPKPKTPEPVATVDGLKSDAPKSGSLMPPLVAGLVGGAVSAAAILFFFPPGPSDTMLRRSIELEAIAAETNQRLGELEESVSAGLAGIQTSPSGPGLEPVKAEIAAEIAALDEENRKLLERLKLVETGLGEAKAMLEQLEPATAGTNPVANNLSIEQIDKNRAAIDELTVEVERLAVTAVELEQTRTALAKVAEAAEIVEQNASLSVALFRLQLKFENGDPFTDTLEELRAGFGAEIPTALSLSAESGALTIEQLQQEFPAAARVGLKASLKAEGGDDMGSRLAAFLKSQIGARSLEEKDGDDPDAVLSRAEGALRRGEVQASLDLLAQLPAEGQAEMEGWRNTAEAYLTAKDALDGFVASLNPDIQE